MQAEARLAQRRQICDTRGMRAEPIANPFLHQGSRVRSLPLMPAYKARCLAGCTDRLYRALPLRSARSGDPAALAAYGGHHRGKLGRCSARPALAYRNWHPPGLLPARWPSVAAGCWVLRRVTAVEPAFGDVHGERAYAAPGAGSTGCVAARRGGCWGNLRRARPNSGDHARHGAWEWLSPTRGQSSAHGARLRGAARHGAAVGVAVVPALLLSVALLSSALRFTSSAPPSLCSA